MIELTQEFGFDAAHRLGLGSAQNAQLHGHSFYAEVTLRGAPDPATGWLRDLGEVKAVLETVRGNLDHRLLNEVDGLGIPTLENLARFIFASVKRELPETVRVRVRRPSFGQSCVYDESERGG
jgi:6-pyruvoyltetrahydropterin/6-carboxytetrahydropterin synthase